MIILTMAAKPIVNFLHHVPFVGFNSTWHYGLRQRPFRIGCISS